MTLNNNQFERELGWDDEIQDDGEDFIILKPGNYDFVVKKFERGRFDGSEKMPACNMALVTITVEDPDTGRQVDVQNRILLHRKTEWTISAFFASLGMKKKGEKIKPQWNMIVAKVGKCKIKNREYNGNLYNEVDKFYRKEEEVVNQQASWGF
ncbi:DUF669 domain-containing protein [Erysipelothrix rhusiopathiae]|uniref:DUF669 domain-containing protein n=1 Tax=Erysipelothrix rhusiopathiae TaxID=1648 RepID=UPI000789DD85|nr:DUF669 domain-containing protein [Erysipelothrix rhusiopathiae]AMS11405.1 hypothetical protein A2I91_06540 [Erysipelothrix rhusiopathiae]AOO67903.1 DUF669 domain-containing protein [Erysipelothrix rhusiopathiae]AWU41250.1 DUF669 domain-containing protein [Erysipelothrix rhusiopathiae]MDV7678092.1 DUF669 domain-containing protein [Erysipelothrix rhusiopathiae]MDV7681344.1 DUF669 domain-containing protein [Erysipelothrix rhusiopathiae]